MHYTQYGYAFMGMYKSHKDDCGKTVSTRAGNFTQQFEQVTCPDCLVKLREYRDQLQVFADDPGARKYMADTHKSQLAQLNLIFNPEYELTDLYRVYDSEGYELTADWLLCVRRDHITVQEKARRVYGVLADGCRIEYIRTDIDKRD